MIDKASLRRTLLAKRDGLSLREREEKSAEIMKRLVTLPEYKSARSVFVYADFKSEVMTRALMVHIVTTGKRLLASKTLIDQKRLALTPVTDPLEDLVAGYMGIPEPREGILEDTPVGEVDLTLTPAVGYDSSGNRLGYGGGFYDRLFGEVREGAPRIGLAYEMQIVPEVPAEDHDIPIPIIVTEDRVIRV
ncbi:MAG: 5-formyltetrahydrofolate cyclo-ligase [bacterium]|nr:5-formyltetrahydrofolate cyclo-ligase [bacterium]